MSRPAPDPGPPASGRPRFSVVIPTHGRRATVTRNVEALGRQAQRDFEAIVVVDGAKKVVARYPPELASFDIRFQKDGTLILSR